MSNLAKFANHKHMKRFILLFLVSLFCMGPFASPLFTNNLAYAEDGQASQKVYVYDDDGNLLIEKSGVQNGDTFLTEDFSEWTIYFIEGNTAFARKQQSLKKPLVKVKNSISSQANNKKICLYLTHNDESYRLSDGYDSIYGAGGVHDVAKQIKRELEKDDINVYLDETLHIPHDSSAYVRSRVTATSLQNKYNPSGLFDIHRDATARSVYYSENENSPLSKIRIVVGKGNANFEKNYAFAKEVFSVGQALYPWLFLDIYCGKGTYNQNLQDHALLFEMGTYLIEKDLVLNSTPYLANVLNTVLFKSEDDDGDIAIDEETIQELEEDYQNRNNLTINNENIDKNDEKSIKDEQKNTNVWIITIFSSLTVASISVAIFLVYKNKIKNSIKK